MKRRVLVHKLDTRGRIAVTYEAEVVEELPNGVRLDAVWTRPTRDLGYTTFDEGAHFTEWFFTDRWYNIFEIHGAEGELLGWYCNIGEPAEITRDEIRYRDLHLDLWVGVGGDMRVLDEDELAADVALDAATRGRARAALATLQRLVQERVAPFDKVARRPAS